MEEMVHVKEIITKLLDQIRLMDVLSDLEDDEREDDGKNETEFV